MIFITSCLTADIVNCSMNNVNQGLLMTDKLRSLGKPLSYTRWSVL